MSQEQLVMQDAELEFDAESHSHEDDDEVEAEGLQEVTAEAEETISDELLAPELNKVMDATQLYLGEIGFSRCLLPKRKSTTPVVPCGVTKQPASA